jgi:hypothetical protein
MFSNLDSLKWYPQSPPESGSVFHHIRLFLTPDITSLTLYGIKTVSDLSTLSNLAVRCPSLRNVRLGLHAIDVVQEISRISTFVCGLKHIESLTVPTLDDIALVYLAQTPCLTSLEVDDLRPFTSSFWCSDYGIFPTLTHLILSNMDDTSRLMALWGKRSLVELQSGSTGPNFTNILARQFYSSVALHCSHSSLQILQIGDGVNDPVVNADQVHMYSVGADILRILFCFTNLVTVWLASPVGFDLDDSQVTEIACAWPHLEDLSLEASPERHIHPRTTLESVYAFAKHCPYLQTLQMTFDATQIPQMRPSGMRRVTQGALDSLSVATSPISKPRSVAKFLSTIFPRLRRIGTLHDNWSLLDDERANDEDVVKSHRLWKVVEETLLDY